MEGSPASREERQLRRAVRDLVALSSLPAVWSAFEPEGIADSLGEVLLRILELDFVFVTVRLGDEPAISLARGRGRSDAEAAALHETLAPWLGADSPQPPPPLQDPSGASHLQAALARFGHSGDHGVVLALSRREGFPTDIERLLLGVGANHTATVLQRKRDEEALRRQNRALATLIRSSSELAADRDLESIVQTAVDAGRELTGAAFGAFFYNVVGAKGDSYMLYALSGASRESFAGFPMPRSTSLFGPTFRGEGTIRSADVARDPRYGAMPPYHGLPPGHLPVRSYLATPVVSRSGEVIGGLFFGHPEIEVFRGDHERVIEGLAAHAAIAIDNARLYRSLQAELSERQLAEQALREAAERKDEFLAMLGHELRNPLAPIRNSLQILDHLESDAQAHRKARGIMERQLVHLTRLVDDLLDVSRISRGKIHLRTEDLELRELVGHTVDDHRHAMTEAGLQLDLELPSDDLWIRGDRVRLTQSLGNLLENACKFSEPGGRVAVTVTRDGAQAVVRVVDDGVGIAPEDLPRIFETFSQSRAARERSRTGLGLGLSVVKSLVELHGGSVRAHSDGPGRGAELVLRLPLLEQRAPAAEPPPGDSAAASPDHRVLVIEDHVDSAETLSELLRLHGHRVEVAHDGSQGIAKAREFRPDVVLCDIGLPGGLDGYEVARSLRRDAAVGGPFLVALTGFGQESDRQRAREAGFDAHLTKPADPSALKRLLAERRAPVGNGT